MYLINPLKLYKNVPSVSIKNTYKIYIDRIRIVNLLSDSEIGMLYKVT